MGSGIYLGLEQKKMVYGKEKAVEKDTGDVRGKVEIYSAVSYTHLTLPTT